MELDRPLSRVSIDHAQNPLSNGLAPAPFSTPPRPRSVQCHSARPQSNRFLKETLAKLSDDSIRIGRRLVAELGSRSPSPLRAQTPLALPEQAGWLAAWELRGGQVDNDLSAPAPCGGTPCPQLEGPLQHHEQEARQLGECSAFDARDAMLAVARVISAWERDTGDAARAWARHVDAQVHLHSANDERWGAMQAQLQALEERLQAVDRRVAERSAVALGFEAEQRGANSRAQVALEALAEGLAEAGRGSARRAEALGAAVAAECGAVVGQLRRLFFDDGGDSPAAGGPTIDRQLQAVRERLVELADVGREDNKQWRETADRWHQMQQAAVLAAERATSQTAEVERDVVRLEREVEELRAKFSAARAQLEDAERAPVAVSLSRLKAVEKRGHVRLDRQSGQLEVLQGLDFAPSKLVAGEPAAAFCNAAAAAEALGDLAEVWRMFDGPLDIELQLRPGKGSKPEVSDRLAAAQATFLREELVRAGVPEIMLTAKGLQAAKGQESSLRLFLKRDVFAGVPSTLPEKKKASSKSPVRGAR